MEDICVVKDATAAIRFNLLGIDKWAEQIGSTVDLCDERNRMAQCSLVGIRSYVGYMKDILEDIETVLEEFEKWN